MIRTGKLISCGIVAVLLVFAASLAVIAAEAQPPDMVTIKAALWPTPTKAPVELTHKKHAEDHKIACADCHHKYEGGKNVWKQGDAVQKCEACHTDPTIQGEKKLPEAQQKLNLKLAFHNNCQECHKAAKQKDANSKAPVVCTGCHPASK